MTSDTSPVNQRAAVTAQSTSTPDAEPAIEPSRAPILLADLTSPAFAAISAEVDMVLIPVGAHEQHGPALPVSTDTLSAQVLSAMVGALLRPQVAVAPPFRGAFRGSMPGFWERSRFGRKR